MNTLKKIFRFVCGAADIGYNAEKALHNIIFVMIVCLMIFQSFDFCVKEWKSAPFPEDITYENQYIKQIDAFKKGQLHLDIETDGVLASLENPYDPVKRNEAGALYHWDHAYYKGKYYSYFGIAPIFTVYLPFEALSGEVPNEAYVCRILGVYAIIFTALALREAVLYFCKKVNLYLFLASAAALVSASGIYLGVLCADVYYIPVISAIGCSMAFAFFALGGIREKKSAPRMVFWACAAVALTLNVLSRPTAALMSSAIFILVFGELHGEFKNNKRRAVLQASSLVLPLFAGACFVMWYNASRFGSVFDFGASYQLTVSDIGANKTESGFIFSSIFSYFFYPFWKNGKTGLTVMGGQHVLPPDSRYVYGDIYVGAFALGLPSAVLFFRASLEKNRKSGENVFCKNASVICVIVLSLSIAFFNFCYAGVNMRYIYDIVPMLALMGAVILLNIHGQCGKKEKILWAFVCVLMFCISFKSNDILIEAFTERVLPPA